MKIELHIDELVLHGFPAAQRHRIGDAVQRELTALIAAQGLPPSMRRDREVPQLGPTAVHLAAGWTPATLGAQLAAAIHGEMPSAPREVNG